jgi:hypothetical protein
MRLSGGIADKLSTGLGVRSHYCRRNPATIEGVVKADVIGNSRSGVDYVKTGRTVDRSFGSHMGKT